MNHDILPFQGLFLHILASGAVRNLIVASKHYVLGHGKHFPTIIKVAAILESKMSAMSSFIFTYLGFWGGYRSLIVVGKHTF